MYDIIYTLTKVHFISEVPSLPNIQHKKNSAENEEILHLNCVCYVGFIHFSVVLGAASMGLVITYPLAKRITFWPQAFLGKSLFHFLHAERVLCL